MRRATRASWTACVVCAALAATGCGSDSGDGSSSGGGGGTFTAQWGDPQNPLEPANTNEVQGGKVLKLITRGLVIYDPKTAEPKNMLAQSIKSDDQKNWTVKLKKGFRFSNGEPVTADSFVDAWNYAANIKNRQVNATFFRYIDGYDKVHPTAEGSEPSAQKLSGLKVVNDRTFTVKLSQEFSIWPETLGYPAFAPLPKAFFDNHDAWLDKPIGNGPYKIESFSRGTSMKLVKDGKYKGDDAAKNDGVELKVYTDQNTAFTDLQAGNLDISDELPAGQLANARNDLGDRFINQKAGIIQTLAFPLYDDAWGGADNVDLRRGISKAIDRDQITKQIYDNTRIPAKDWTSPVIGAKGGFDDTICGDLCTFDPKQAKKLIDGAGGLPGGKVTISSNVDTGSHREWMDAVCNSINKALGKENACVVNPIGTFADFRTQVVDRSFKGPFRAGWQMDYPLIENFLSPTYVTGASSNDGEYSNKKFDRLINQANAAESTAAAVKKYKEAERLLAKDVPSIPLWYQNGIAGHSDRVTDVTLDPFSVPNYPDVKVK
ncbi:peptide ABC transporter substrate-binding protein [Streptomyces sp. CMB-StM0423]|uniref:peptide ABC transporter substrate-binding protein n=1 Tax=Streptomyces sp. CMB-StM0423 TaxID=2059884 RepID=UPI000C70CD45|nr:ABC transporter substrate-binding protein [Streptomyces sp. CMB-StM0423]AUH40813.1 peptide ABC transporter substrate-binding protein [Streptomyces sp. CMB-StM0423]